jgi:lysyl-tRNA synthetase class 2
LVGGLDRVFEIGRNYRNEGIDTRHNPEFTMMESYQAYGDFDDLCIHTRELLCYVDQYCLNRLPNSAKQFYNKWHEERPFSLTESHFINMEKAVHWAADKAGFKLEAELMDPTAIYKSEAPRIARYEQTAEARRQALQECQGQTYGQRVAIWFGHIAEPFLVQDYRLPDGSKSVPVFVTDFPTDICPLARPNDKNPKICDRFELFIEGQELANAFQELNDPDEQARRFKEQIEINKKDPMDYDADYIEALEYGMPPAVGLGLGIDRLVMLLTNTSTIKDVILFPTLKPLK